MAGRKHTLPPAATPLFSLLVPQPQVPIVFLL